MNLYEIIGQIVCAGGLFVGATLLVYLFGKLLHRGGGKDLRE